MLVLHTIRLLAISLATGAVALNRQPHGAPVATSFIIEYTPGVDARIADTDGVSVRKTFRSPVFTGASIETTQHDTASLLQLAHVKNVWTNERVQLLPVADIEIHDAAPENSSYWSVHGPTGVAELHSRGFKGKGAKVAVVDTGVWYDHPALGGGFGAGFKVAGGYDLVGDQAWPYSGEKEPDDDPKDQDGHGSHVAGIVAGKTDNWTGVAPEANIYAYKVFSQDSYTDDETLIDAFLRAFDDGVDIITCSIGGTGGWSDNGWAEIASRLVEEGVVVTIAAGNNGDVGPVYGESGSSGSNVLSVASIEAPSFPSFPYAVNLTTENGTDASSLFGYIPAYLYDPFPASAVGLPVVPWSLNMSATDDACAAPPPDRFNFTGAVVLVRRSVTCEIYDQQKIIDQLGASYILVYNDDRSPAIPLSLSDLSLIALTSKEAGEAIISTIAAGGMAVVDFSIDQSTPVSIPYPVGGLPSIFSSWGPLYDLQVKPDVAAPGGRIYSTYINDQFAIFSGTSMATPYVAGVAALYVGAFGGRNVDKNRARGISRSIIAAGTAVPWSLGTANIPFDSDGVPFTANVAQVGSGLIDARKVVAYDTVLDFEKIALNDTGHFTSLHNVTVTNTGNKEIAYRVSAAHDAAVEAAGWLPADRNFLAQPTGVWTRRIKEFSLLTPKRYVPEIRFPDDFTLGPGESRTISVEFENPNNLGWNASALPFYSGRILVSGNNAEELSVPYFGIGADLLQEFTEAPFFEGNWPFIVSTRNSTRIEAKSSFSMDLRNDFQDFPKLRSKVLWGSREVRWDVFEAGWTEDLWSYPPMPTVNGYIGPVAGWEYAGYYDWIDTSSMDPNETFTYPIRNRPRSHWFGWAEHWWFGKLGNGSQIDPGDYTLRFAILKPFGDRQLSKDWEVYDKTEITITGKYQH